MLQKISKLFGCIFLLVVVLNIFTQSAKAQDQSTKSDTTQVQQGDTKSEEKKVEGVITKVSEEKEITIMGKKQLYQKLEVLLTEGGKIGRNYYWTSWNFR